MAMTPERFVRDLEQVHGRHLVAAILYGSAASGERHARWSDFNLLVVLDRMEAEDLRRAAGPVRRWIAAGNHPPVTMTPAFLKRSAAAFPLEWADMSDAHRVLAGRDVLRGVRVSRRALRAELERELRTALLRLLGELQALGGFLHRSRLRASLIRANSTFQVLFRGALRLGGTTPLPAKREAAAALAKALKFDPAPFLWVDRLKHGDSAARSADPWPWAGRYVREVERLVSRLDAWNA